MQAECSLFFTAKASQNIPHEEMESAKIDKACHWQALLIELLKILFSEPC
jgi:ABC-type glycerol-3-phosphate transport system permease component